MVPVLRAVPISLCLHIDFSPQCGGFLALALAAWCQAAGNRAEILADFGTGFQSPARSPFFSS